MAYETGLLIRPATVADGTVAGFVALSRWSDRAAHDDTAETTLYVHSSRHNRGIGRELYAALIAEARRRAFHTLIARITGDSAASLHLHLHLHRSAGFVHVGTPRGVGRNFGRPLDVHVLQLVLD